MMYHYFGYQEINLVFLLFRFFPLAFAALRSCSLQIKKSVEETQKALDDLNATHADTSRIMQDILEPWKEHLQRMVDKLDVLFSE